MKNWLLQFSLAAVVLAALSSCSKVDEPIRIAVNPWPGYEFLYLAEQKGLFEKEGLNVKLIQLGSLADAQRAYLNGYSEGLASTLVEAVQIQVLGSRPLSVVMIPDYSNGGDVIITRKDIKSLKDLRGKTVGGEVSSLGIYFLERALRKNNMTLTDVKVINVEQVHGKAALQRGEIDAFVTYPPISISILGEPDYHTIFSSSDIPEEIIDTVSIANDILEENPELVAGLRRVWQESLNYFEANQDEAVRIMAEREGITPKEFLDTLSDLKILTTNQQVRVMSDSVQLNEIADSVCSVLVDIQSLTKECSQLTPLFTVSE